MKNSVTLMGRAFALTSIFSAFFSLTTQAQQRNSGGLIAQKVAAFKHQGLFTKETALFAIASNNKAANEVARSVRQFSLLDIPGAAEVLQTKPAFLQFEVPGQNGGPSLNLLFYKESISPNGFNLLCSDGKKYEAPDIVHYKGSVDGDVYSVAAISFSKDEVSGLISTNNENIVIGKLQDGSGIHIIYNDRAVIDPKFFDCGTNTGIPQSPRTHFKGTESSSALTTKCVNWYWETDYDLYVAKQSSVANVTSYMQNVFNQVQTLYANDGISITLKTLFVWTATDPYTGPSTSNYLTQFGTNRTSFDGDLAALMGTQGGGGIAWVDGLCQSQTRYKQSYCGISTNYSTVPNFSWTVECITHEQGHQLGSRHTHDCVWNGNNTKIDGCGDNAGYSSGSCPNPGDPSGGGTIMSYCHLRSVGINFNLGFGPQPKALIIDNINTSSCLTNCSSGCTVPGQPGTISGNIAPCSASTQTYSVSTISGASGYTWTLPSGWTGTSTTNTITVTAGSNSGNITVTAVNSCGNSTARTLAVAASTVPAQPGSISGSTAVCPSSPQAYSVPVVQGASGYTWTLPTGWTGSSTTNSINVTAGSSGGSITVRANNACGSGAVRTLTVSSTAASPAQPAAIAGAIAVCPASLQTYSVSAVSGATGYNWTLPAGWTGSSTTNTITATVGSSGGTISVSASNGCGTSAARTLLVNIGSGTAPAKPGVISVSGGIAKVCPGDTRIYSVPNVAGIVYNWTAPAGGNIISGQGTSSISITYTPNFTANGILSVTASSGCGTSAPRTVTVARNIPASSAAISGPATVCSNTLGTYTATAVAGASSYAWTIPSGATVQGPSNTNSITILWGTRGGNLAVRAVNNCGLGGSRSLKITVNCSGGTTEGIEMYSGHKAHLYPNPTTDIANIRFYSGESTLYTLSVTDVTGRKLFTEKKRAAVGMNIHQFNLSKFTKGSYFIVIESRNGRETLKVSLQ